MTCRVSPSLRLPSANGSTNFWFNQFFRRVPAPGLRGFEGLSEAQAAALLQIPITGSDVAADEIIIPDLTVR
jgi:hypothetical protein